ncbi:MAG TPA: type II secretion system protein GspJ [Thermodesulfobacteriota bacterium]|nr:type II secretion system protein GspJ [Thermodesulfobacteriota bacterium]
MKRRAKDSNTGATTGFTLLEVVVTLTILGLILLIISGAFRLGLSAWEKGESAREGYDRVRTVSRLVCQQIKSSVPYRIKTEKAEEDYIGFEGTPHLLKFVSALPIKAKQPQGFVYAIYEFQEGGQDGGRLVYYEQRVLNKNFFEEKPNEELSVSLMEGIADVQFEYFRRGDKDKNWTEGWVENWNAKDEKELPKALRMTITSRDKKDGKEEVPLTLMASISANRYEEIVAAQRRFTAPMLQRPGQLTR